jgi:hypothetical protein
MMKGNHGHGQPNCGAKQVVGGNVQEDTKTRRLLQCPRCDAIEEIQ